MELQTKVIMYSLIHQSYNVLLNTSNSSDVHHLYKYYRNQQTYFAKKERGSDNNVVIK